MIILMADVVGILGIGWQTPLGVIECQPDFLRFSKEHPREPFQHPSSVYCSARWQFAR